MFKPIVPKCIVFIITKKKKKRDLDKITRKCLSFYYWSNSDFCFSSLKPRQNNKMYFIMLKIMFDIFVWSIWNGLFMNLKIDFWNKPLVVSYNLFVVCRWTFTLYPQADECKFFPHKRCPFYWSSRYCTVTTF